MDILQMTNSNAFSSKENIWNFLTKISLRYVDWDPMGSVNNFPIKNSTQFLLDTCILSNMPYLMPHCNVYFLPGGGALRVKISRGAPLEVQNGTQQDLNKMIDLVNFAILGKKDRLHAENGGLRNGNQKDLNKMVDKVKIWGAKRSSRCRKWGAKPQRIPTDSQRGSAPPPPGVLWIISTEPSTSNLAISVIFQAWSTFWSCSAEHRAEIVRVVYIRFQANHSLHWL